MKSTISPEYAALNKQLHHDNAEYGTTAGKGANPQIVLAAIRQGNHKVILDYGCGKGTLKTALATMAPDVTVLEYDPAVEGKETIPDAPIDLLVAMDVMEHIEPAFLNDVLQSMCDVNPKGGVFLIIDLEPANKTLPDGRNAHLIVRPAAWWRSKLTKYFKRTHTDETPRSYLFMGAVLPSALRGK